MFKRVFRKKSFFEKNSIFQKSRFFGNFFVNLFSKTIKKKKKEVFSEVRELK